MITETKEKICPRCGNKKRLKRRGGKKDGDKYRFYCSACSSARSRLKYPEKHRIAVFNSTEKSYKRTLPASLSRQPWDIIDDAFLEQNISKMKYEELAIKLGRTLKSITARVFKLGLTTQKFTNE